MPHTSSGASPQHPQSRVHDQLARTVGSIMVFSRTFEIGDYGPGLADLTLLSGHAYLAHHRAVTAKGWHLYVNPQWTVLAPATTSEREFVREAERACISWMTRLRRTLGRGPVNRMLRAMAPDARTLAACGVLVIAGHEAHTKRLNWRATSKTRRVCVSDRAVRQAPR